MTKLEKVHCTYKAHFDAYEQPQLFAEELRAAFKSLRQTNATVLNR